jgi:hypothetical protein
MRPDLTSDVMAALLQILERVERPVDEVPLSTPRQWAGSRDEAKPLLANPRAADQSDNRLVERIASAMLKLRVQRG